LTDSGWLASIRTTIFVKGILISRTIIGRKRYLDGTASLFKTEEVVEDNDGNYSNYSNQDLLKIVLKPMTDESNVLASSSPSSIFKQEPEYIHIENASFYVHTGNAVLPLSTVEGAYWRGKISSIDGFVIGTIGTYPSSEQCEMK